MNGPYNKQDQLIINKQANAKMNKQRQTYERMNKSFVDYKNKL